jgi:NAD(P)-dependent dehydrogenase (short-subunit alcohol dehydrogenase family)
MPTDRPAGTVAVVRLDVTEPDDLRRVADELAATHGHLDVLVNNAAVLYDTWQRAAAADLDTVRAALETNLLGAWRAVLAFLPLLRASPHSRVVNVSSGAGSLAEMGAGTLSAARAASAPRPRTARRSCGGSRRG